MRVEKWVYAILSTLNWLLKFIYIALKYINVCIYVHTHTKEMSCRKGYYLDCVLILKLKLTTVYSVISTE